MDYFGVTWSLKIYDDNCGLLYLAFKDLQGFDQKQDICYEIVPLKG